MIYVTDLSKARVLGLVRKKENRMTKNLETADTIIKLMLAMTVIVLHATHVTAGPFSWVLMMLGFLVITIYAIRAALALYIRD
jgi:hypothetical protein